MTTSQSRQLNSLLVLVALGTLVLQAGCATIMSEKQYPVTIDNTHGPTFFSVHDRKNNVIAQGITPQQVTLDAKAHPFWPAKYAVVFAGNESTTQRRDVKAKFDPWTAGNLVLGGGIGLVVDGASGAMFKLPKTISGEIPAQFAVTDTYQGSSLARAVITPQAAGTLAAGTLAAGTQAAGTLAAGTLPSNSLPVIAASHADAASNPGQSAVMTATAPQPTTPKR